MSYTSSQRGGGKARGGELAWLSEFEVTVGEGNNLQETTALKNEVMISL